MRKMPGALAVAVAALLAGSTSPALASGYRVTIRESSTQPTVGAAPLTISGAITGGGATRLVYLQYVSAGRWTTIARQAPKGGRYSLATRRVAPGNIKYRVAAVNSRGALTGVSPTIAAAWYSWQNVTQTNDYVPDGSTSPGTYSFDGVSYPNSLQIGVASYSHPLQTHAHGLCRALRWHSDYDASSQAGHPTVNVAIALDGDTVYSATVATGNPALQLDTLAGHEQVYWTLSPNGDAADHTNPTSAMVDIGTPQMLCRGVLPHN